MLVIECQGTPFEIGFQHGSMARKEVERSVIFYTKLFKQSSNRDWNQVRDTAARFESLIKSKWPKYHEEMQGVAAGAGYDLLDIIALNVRTEIAFGLFMDGCTSICSQTSENTFLGQNWDWQEEQKANLLILTIKQVHLPTIKVVTEAGIIGKIGLNSAAVGVCFNAIRVPGIDYKRMPAHLALRRVLESRTATEAVEVIASTGVASSCYMLVADKERATGVEFTSRTVKLQQRDKQGRVIHANHLLEDHGNIQDDPAYVPDSHFRVGRMTHLADQLLAIAIETQETASLEQAFAKLFVDEDNFPTSICRAQEGKSTAATLFNIVMDLRQKRAVVRQGRPCQPEEVYVLDFGDLRASL